MKQLYAVFDKAARAYGNMMSYAHDAVAVRDFKQAALDPKTSLFTSPDDFELHALAWVDDVLERSSQEDYPIKGFVPRVVVTASAVRAMSATGPELMKEA